MKIIHSSLSEHKDKSDIDFVKKYLDDELDLTEFKNADLLSYEEKESLEFIEIVDNIAKQNEFVQMINKIHLKKTAEFFENKKPKTLLVDKVWFRSGIAAMLFLMAGSSSFFYFKTNDKISALQPYYPIERKEVQSLSSTNTQPKKLIVKNQKIIYTIKASHTNPQKTKYNLENKLNFIVAKSLKSIMPKTNIEKIPYELPSENFNNLLAISPKGANKSFYSFNSNKNDILKGQYLSKMIDLKNASSYVQFAWLHIDRKNFKEAEKAYNKAIKLEPKNPDLYAGRAVFYTLCGNYEKAENDYNMRIKLDPNNPICYEYRAWFYNGMMLFDEAERDFTACISLDPNEPHNYKNRQYFYEKIGKWKKAKEDCVSHTKLTKSEIPCLL